MPGKICEQCHNPFQPSRSAPHQRICGKEECRRKRKRLWQRRKLQTDEDYRKNQAAANQAWRARNPGYMAEYRRRVPEYVKKNRARQFIRNRQARTRIVKMESLPSHPDQLSGRFLLVPANEGVIVKMDGLLVDLKPVSSPSATQGP